MMQGESETFNETVFRVCRHFLRSPPKEMSSARVKELDDSSGSEIVKVTGGTMDLIQRTIGVIQVKTGKKATVSVAIHMAAEQFLASEDG